jgi:hypothetical protein
MTIRRRIGGNRRSITFRHLPETAEFSGFQAKSTPSGHRIGIGGELADTKHLTGAAPNGTLPSVSDMGSVTVIRTVARYAPLRLRAANSLTSLSNLPLSPPAPIQNLIGGDSAAIGGTNVSPCRAIFLNTPPTPQQRR